MTRTQLDLLLEKAVADALGVALGDRPRRTGRRPAKSANGGTTRRS